MPDHSGKTFPVPTPETMAFWEAGTRHELQVQQCSDCGHLQFYPRLICTACTGRALKMVPVSGHATVSSYTIITRPVSRGYADDVPYIVALVELSEGPRMMTNIINCEPADIKTGLPVSVVFEDWSDEISIPKFQPVKQAS